MTINWTGPNRGKLRRVLLDLYPDIRRLKRFVSDRFDCALTDLSETTPEDWAEDLIEKARSEGWIDKLYREFWLAHPDNLLVVTLRSELKDPGLKTSIGGSGEDAGVVRRSQAEDPSEARPDPDFRPDMERLIGQLEQIVELPERKELSPQGPKNSGKKQQLSAAERLALSTTLNRLTSVEFDQLVMALNPPAGIIPPNHAAQGNRTPAFLGWIEGPTGPGLNELQSVLAQVTSQSLPASSDVDALPGEEPTDLTPGQRLRLADRKRKLVEAQGRLETIDTKIAEGVDFEEEEKLERRKEGIYRKIDELSREIQAIERGNG